MLDYNRHVFWTGNGPCTLSGCQIFEGAGTCDATFTGAAKLEISADGKLSGETNVDAGYAHSACIKCQGQGAAGTAAVTLTKEMYIQGLVKNTTADGKAIWRTRKVCADPYALDSILLLKTVTDCNNEVGGGNK